MPFEVLTAIKTRSRKIGAASPNDTVFRLRHLCSSRPDPVAKAKGDLPYAEAPAKSGRLGHIPPPGPPEASNLEPLCLTPCLP